MGIEQEFKFQLDQVYYERFKNELKKHWVGQKTYWNIYYDTEREDLREINCALRATIQDCGYDGLYELKFTFKGPKEQSGGLVVCEEVEYHSMAGGDCGQVSRMQFLRDYSILRSPGQAGDPYRRAREETGEDLFLLVGGVRITRDMYFHKAVFFELDEIMFEKDTRNAQYELEVETLAPEPTLEVVQEVANKALGRSKEEGVTLTPSNKGKQQRLYDYLEQNGKSQKIFEW